MQELPLAQVYQVIEPGPVVLLVTADNSRANVMTMSWHMMMEFTPPRVACIVSEANHSFAALRRTRECVIAVPARKLAATMVKVGNCSGAAVDKMDLLTVIAHELGHIAGLSDADDSLDSLMSGSLSAGERRLPGADVSDALFAADAWR